MADASKVIDIKKCINLNKIDNMAAFSIDWNGNGASVFSESAITQFRNIIQALNQQPEIAPTGRNSLLMQYELADKSILAFEVTEKETEKVYVPQGDYTLLEVEIFTEDIAEKMNTCVEKFYGFK